MTFVGDNDSPMSSNLIIVMICFQVLNIWWMLFQVSDFGLARLASDTHSHVSTRVMGTFGYLAPEYAQSGKLTEKSDVYSFGVVLLELISGRKPVDTTQPPGQESLVEWARPLMTVALEDGDLNYLVDPRLGDNYDPREMFRMIEAAASCVRHSASKRPRMSQVCGCQLVSQAIFVPFSRTKLDFLHTLGSEG